MSNPFTKFLLSKPSPRDHPKMFKDASFIQPVSWNRVFCRSVSEIPLSPSLARPASRTQQTSWHEVFATSLNSTSSQTFRVTRLLSISSATIRRSLFSIVPYETSFECGRSEPMHFVGNIWLHQQRGPTGECRQIIRLHINCGIFTGIDLCERWIGGGYRQMAQLRSGVHHRLPYLSLGINFVVGFSTTRTRLLSCY